MPRIELHDVSKRWGDFVGVNHLNMVIEDREFITLLGPSGCGKTTTLRMIAGLETPTEGRISIGDTVVFDSEKGINVSPDKRDIGFLFQNYALWPHMTVYKNISFGLENLKWPKSKIEERVQEVLKTLKIEEFKDRYPAELSGGQQQRVAIARTLAPKPKVLFMDEPLSNLDAKLRSEMRTELKRLHSDTNSTFVYVTHDQLEAMTLATRICLIEKGDLQQYDPPLVVYNRPANLFVADFIGNPTMNFVPAKAKRTAKKTYSLREKTSLSASARNSFLSGTAVQSRDLRIRPFRRVWKRLLKSTSKAIFYLPLCSVRSTMRSISRSASTSSATILSFSTPKRKRISASAPLK